MTYSNKTSKISRKDLAIKATSLSFKYDSNSVFNDLNFEIEKGTLTYIVGPNGSGKTTLTSLLMGMLQPTSGSIMIADENLGYLPQKVNQRYDVPISVEEVVYSGLVKQNLWMRKSEKECVSEWLERMGLKDYQNRLLNTLSGGQIQRVLLCRALINNPNLIILDEPTSALDPEFSSIFNQYVHELHEMGKTIIYITHDIQEIRPEKTRVIALNKGIEFEGSVSDYLSEVHHV